MKRLVLLSLTAVLGLVLVTGLAGCGDDDNPGQPGISEFDKLATLGDAYFTSYTTPGGLPVNVTAGAVYAVQTDMDDGNDYYILDWRAPEHFALGHIEGAVNVGKVGTVNVSAVLDDIPAGRVVLNVCYTGQNASYVTSQMNMLGYEAQNLKFGMCGWTSDQGVNLGKWDNAVSDDFNDWLVTQASEYTGTYAAPQWSTGKSDPEDILRARMTTVFNGGFKGITASALYQDIAIDGKADDYFIINYFAPEQYDAGHIPGAMRFQPKESLRADRLLARIPTDKKVVVYCFTGQTSAQVMGYLNALGYDVYSLLYGVNGMCHSNTGVCTVPYHAATTDYPVVTGS